jgi:hypothetical protein
MKKKTLYIIIAILVLLNIGQFIYFYSQVSDLKEELRIIGYKPDGTAVRNCDINKNN